jgi:hypothetical protein
MLWCIKNEINHRCQDLHGIMIHTKCLCYRTPSKIFKIPRKQDMTMVIEGPTEGRIKLQDDDSIHSGK